MGLSVTGGEDGIRACLDDLTTMSRLLSDASTTITEATNMAAFGRLEIGGCGGLDLGPHNGALDDLLAGLTGHNAAACHTADELHRLSRQMTFVAQLYHEGDDSILQMFSSSALGLPNALLKSGITALTTGNPLRAAEQFLTADPSLVDLVGGLPTSQLLIDTGEKYVTDGHPVVTYDCNDLSPVAVEPPRGVGDLVEELALRNEGAAGEISVSFVFGSNGTRRAIVDIPGTKSWTPGHSSDVTSLATNLRAIDGVPTTYEKGVLEAMREAGVTPQDPVMLVGHSEGGMVAVNAARDAVASGQFNVTHVVTAGSPIGHTVGALPKSVSVLALEGRHDVIPRLDGKSNPDEPNITTVTGGKDYGDFPDNHSLDLDYESIAKAVDASDNGSIRAFLIGADGFLDQSFMTTDRYVISRQY